MAPVVEIDGPNEIEVTVGESIRLDASARSDPDGETLRYRWVHYPEPGDFWDWRNLNLKGLNQAVLEVEAPTRVRITAPRTTHLILEVTDSGTPPITRYERIIIKILPLHTGS